MTFCDLVAAAEAVGVARVTFLGVGCVFRVTNLRAAHMVGRVSFRGNIRLSQLFCRVFICKQLAASGAGVIRPVTHVDAGRFHSRNQRRGVMNVAGRGRDDITAHCADLRIYFRCRSARRMGLYVVLLVAAGARMPVMGFILAPFVGPAVLVRRRSFCGNADIACYLLNHNRAGFLGVSVLTLTEGLAVHDDHYCIGQLKSFFCRQGIFQLITDPDHRLVSAEMLQISSNDRLCVVHAKYEGMQVHHWFRGAMEFQVDIMHTCDTFLLQISSQFSKRIPLISGSLNANKFSNGFTVQIIQMNGNLRIFYICIIVLLRIGQNYGTEAAFRNVEIHAAVAHIASRRQTTQIGNRTFHFTGRVFCRLVLDACRCNLSAYRLDFFCCRLQANQRRDSIVQRRNCCANFFMCRGFLLMHDLCRLQYGLQCIPGFRRIVCLCKPLHLLNCSKERLLGGSGKFAAQQLQFRKVNLLACILKLDLIIGIASLILFRNCEGSSVLITAIGRIDVPNKALVASGIQLGPIFTIHGSVELPCLGRVRRIPAGQRIHADLDWA